MLTFTYRIESAIPWVDVVEEPDNEPNRTAGQTLGEQGNHTVSDPIDIDEFTREWTLTFPSVEAWQEYKTQVIDNTSDTSFANDGFNITVVSTPDD